jgi:hypothetical protein
MLALIIDSTKVVTDSSTFGELAGYALIILVVFIGFALIANGWPKFGKK